MLNNLLSQDLPSTTLMVQGCTSDAGKSAVVTALCRILRRRGVKVAPFKPQNMALNSAVTIDGGEIGRAQAVQAQAAGIEPHTDMNPVLLKPNSDTGAQVIIQGKALMEMSAKDYHDYKPRAMEAIMQSHQRLADQHDVVMVEGAGSPAEVNLRARDVANMGFAECADCPVVIVADIDKGGVFAHLLGTLSCLSESEQNRVVGFVINRFRGDIALLEPGLEWLEEKTGKRVIGVIPYLQGFHLEAEDAVETSQEAKTAIKLRIAVPRLRRISNHTDFDVLRLHPNVELIYTHAGQALPEVDLIILPGSKSVRSDLQFLKDQGWDRQIQRHLRYGGKVLGVCGGYQMLGHAIHDPKGIEGEAGSMQGLGLLDIETTLESSKQLKTVKGEQVLGVACNVEGYEIHAGVTSGEGLKRPVINLETGPDGALNQDGNVLGCYLHGLFDHPEARDVLLQWAGLPDAEPFDYFDFREKEIDRLATACEKSLDLDYLFSFEKVQ